MQRHYICVTDAVRMFKRGQEKAFKKYKSEQWKQMGRAVLWIESPETAVGCPDVLVFATNDANFAMMYEFKVSDENGSITFDENQPLFYKKNGNIPMRVIAYDVQSGQEIVFDTDTALKEMQKKVSRSINLKSIRSKII